MAKKVPPSSLPWNPSIPLERHLRVMMVVKEE